MKDDDGSVAGCHATEQEANNQVAALYAQEQEEGDGDGESASDPVLAAVYRSFADEDDGFESVPSLDAESYSKGYWQGPLVVEGVETGDFPRREFKPGSVIWRDLPLPLSWQEKSAEGHLEAWQVGSIDHIWRNDPSVMGRGRFDMDDEHAVIIHGKMSKRMAGGVSVGVDDMDDSDVELIFPEGQADVDDDDGLEALFAEPEKMLFLHARIMEATLVATPALQEAKIELVPDSVGDAWYSEDARGRDEEPEPVEEPDEVLAVDGEVFGAVGTHDTGTARGVWNASANEARLASPMAVETARNAYAWIEDGAVEDGQVAKSACKFIHHNVGTNGRPGAANLTACSAGIGALNGARGGSSIPVADRQGVYNHLAAHLRDGNQEPPELMAIESAQQFAALAEVLDAPTGLVVVARPDQADTLMVENGDPADDLHVTLGFYGDAAEVGDDVKVALREWVDEHAGFSTEARVSGVARMGQDDPQATALLIEAAELADLRASLEQVAMPNMEHPHFTPHMTLGYGLDLPDELPTSIVLSGVEVWEAGERYVGGGEVLSAAGPPVKPPSAWFHNPKLPGPTPGVYDASGRCYGHLATWGACHLSFMPRVCVTPPKGSDYSGFRVGTIECDDGTVFNCGALTLGAMHAPASLGFAPSLHHYEHTGHAVADVTVGEDEWGIWFAGALRPDVTDRHLRILRASGVSGDWRRTRTGRWRLAGALIVNVPGFPVPRVQTHVSGGEQTALVAAGVLTTPQPRRRSLVAAANRIARSIGLDKQSRIRMLRERVLGESLDAV